MVFADVSTYPCKPSCSAKKPDFFYWLSLFFVSFPCGPGKDSNPALIATRSIQSRGGISRVRTYRWMMYYGLYVHMDLWTLPETEGPRAGYLL
jgi:hypothetical protein